MKITPALSRRLHQLLHKTGKMEAKADIVRSYSNGRTSSSTELLFKEAIAIIKHLEAFDRTKIHKNTTSEGPNYKSTEQQIPTSEELKKEVSNRMRRKIIGHLREIGFEKWSEEKRKMEADMIRIYRYIKEVGYLGKELNRYTYEELPKLVSQIESIYLKELKNKK